MNKVTLKNESRIESRDSTLKQKNSPLKIIENAIRFRNIMNKHDNIIRPLKKDRRMTQSITLQGVFRKLPSLSEGKVYNFLYLYRPYSLRRLLLDHSVLHTY